ncbi:hypothetical protein [Kineococcus rubinsiae]|uniref:hypothetical protein n=1 Tax=Kineococcus rubinsiae TaxID=2609562 RepID=UPI001430DBE6|nr:hypothetical protein [Kineococcus rubinsiae]NIZ90425.1 hypothetical protein [Kineococcus rubinsiae]
MDEQPEDDGRGRVQGGLAWALVGATALPVVLSGDVARRVLGGELDYYYGNGGIEPVTLTQRWESLQFFVAPETGTLASALGLAVVAALVVARRPGFLVPPRAARWLAVGVGAVTTLVGLGLVLGTLAYTARDVPDDESGLTASSSVSDYLTLAPHFGVAVLAVALAAAATVVLLRPPPPLPTPAEDAEREPAAGAPVSAEPAEPIEAPAVARDEVQHRPLREEALPGATAAPPALLPDVPRLELPRLREDDLVLYQRPH